MSSLSIRSATAGDRPAIARLLEPIIRAGETYALPRDLSEADSLAYWCSPDHEVLVAEERGAILGTYFLCANQRGGGAHVCNAGYATSIAAQGRGIARAMCADSLERARGRGFRAMQFNFVVSTNTRAVRTWERFGFITVGRLPAAFAHPTHGFVDALVMFRELTPACDSASP
jgi:ribosomal protein S18 acetylase RimI-like enzyme